MQILVNFGQIHNKLSNLIYLYITQVLKRFFKWPIEPILLWFETLFFKIIKKKSTINESKNNYFCGKSYQTSFK